MGKWEKRNCNNLNEYELYLLVCELSGKYLLVRIINNQYIYYDLHFKTLYRRTWKWDISCFNSKRWVKKSANWIMVFCWKQYGQYLCDDYADSFLLVVLAVAMHSKQDIKIDAPVSSRLLSMCIILFNLYGKGASWK